MDVKEVLKIADRLIFTKTGKHLDDLQEAILRGTVQGQKYSKIAEDFHCSEGHIKDAASELWKILSDVVGEDVSKANFRSTMERCRFSNVSSVSSNCAKDFIQINNINLCPKPLPPPQVPEDRSGQVRNPVSPRNRVSVDDAPDIGNFYDRTQQLTILEKWIVQERCRLVALLGISGIGKTALAVQLVEQIKDKFEYVIWQSLCGKPPLAEVQKTLIQFISNQQEIELAVSAEGRLSQLIEYLRKHRCLVILDDVHSVFSNGQLAGCYEPGYQDYGLLFRRIGELSHHSCLVLTSWDKPREIAALEGENKPVRSLQLDGLDMASAREILREKGLAEEEKWEDLINHYQGNPLWLKLVATMIQDLFGGSVSEILKYDIIFLNEDLKDILNQQFNSLSELEKQVMSVLAIGPDPVSISKLLEHIQLSPAELFNAMQSLGRRSLIDKVKQGNQQLFNLQPVVRQYVKTEILH
ncbi:NB-ARC domain-containing protein [Argonema galeatum]|uniref:NB-ARC domain-containing protein n=1 Tax=Argonema galeatum TaxID=2942762 RepID=UPI002010DFFD|nr:NB-ARC domain-containing protein [Argonema galeatum]MCL1465541.1 NACHT domain-containing protein [Argonema galeatum A003/A1]